MKVKNIVFSGIMAAILGATAADAAISVASQAYVDGKIKTNADAISELSQTVADNKTAADATATLVGTLPEGATATTIVGYITEKTTGIATDAKVNELGQTVAGQGEKITALETLTGENGQIAQNIAKTLQDAKDYADGLASNYDAAGSAAAAETAAKGYADEGLAKKENVDNKASAITDGMQKDVMYPTVSLTEELIATSNQDMSDLIGAVADGKTVVEMISDAQAAAEGKVTELANGAVKANADAIAALDTTYVSESEMTAFKETNTAAINAKVAQTDYNAYVSANDAAVQAVTATADKNKADIAAMDAAYKLADTNLETSLKTYADQAEADAVATAAADATQKANAVANTLKFLATAEVPSECKSGSAYCVLTMTTDGAFAWTPLTSPVEE